MPTKKQPFPPTWFRVGLLMTAVYMFFDYFNFFGLADAKMGKVVHTPVATGIAVVGRPAGTEIAPLVMSSVATDTMNVSEYTVEGETIFRVEEDAEKEPAQILTASMKSLGSSTLSVVIKRDRDGLPFLCVLNGIPKITSSGHGTMRQVRFFGYSTSSFCVFTPD